MVRDECQSCAADNLGILRSNFFPIQFLSNVPDMSQGLFEQLGNLDTGVLSIEWYFMPWGWSP
jgi:hypothetical protein